ncbi:GNAT family N-acetyltransferase [uncultured Bilophila sp.]|mgnify:FL=1|uniref:GNAT family N-acetyltransferase n=1 Tax=uncultured Bilophila sp. TaxID=529385 RepID=UPI00266EB0C4|nr:GNAT family N-acetyltransferase [uncultured Bilophila sp.]
MIRAFKEEDTEAVIRIWLEASILSHSFIDKAYWEEKADAMRTLYLPLSEVVVDEDKDTGEVVAFIAFVEDYLAALFVAPAHQKKGVGSRLLALAKKMRDTLELSVYAENERAVAFYRKNGFRMTDKRIEEMTGHTELLMVFP